MPAPRAAASLAIDTHVHVFAPGLPLADRRRYVPADAATPAALIGAMQACAVGHAILVQPSFLGTDNSYLIDTIRERPEMFRGVAVIDPAIAPSGLERLRDAGIVGVRLNCIGEATPDLSTPVFARLAERLARLDLVLEIQAEGEQWLLLAPALGRLDCSVVIDHFGRCDPSRDHGFELLLEAAAANPLVWFKFSAPYRLAPSSPAICARKILALVGPGRVVWGSDWPWTQHEGLHAYQDTIDWLSDWVPDAAHRRAILTENPCLLFGPIKAEIPGVYE